MEMLNHRKLTDDERTLNTHLTMFGAAGVPVRKLGKKWTYGFRSIEAPVLYATKREAAEAFERYYAIVRALLRYEAFVRSLADFFASDPAIVSVETPSHGTLTRDDVARMGDELAERAHAA